MKPTPFIPPAFVLACALASPLFSEPVASSSADAPAPPTFSGPIARLFQKSCQGCHRPGEIAPMPLLSYQDARPWAKAIKKAVAERTMPPWFADPSVGHFLDDPTLTDDEIKMIEAWVDAGAPEGDPAQAPAPLKFPEGWSFGKPDLVIATPSAYAVPSEGEDKFVYIELPTGLAEDKWIEAVEVMPTDRRAVHHVMAYIMNAEEYDEDWSRVLGRNGNFLTEYAAGNGADIYPPETGRLIKAGSTILVQIHYHPYGQRALDRTSIGFKFHADGSSVKRRVVSRAIANFDLMIPPGAPRLPHQARLDVTRPLQIVSFQPHMHFRGSSMQLRAVYPDGRAETLCSVPKYDPNWQITYAFKNPPMIPAGSRLEVLATFDNSEANPFNPDSKATVFWGPLAVDEMAIGWTDVIYMDEAG